MNKKTIAFLISFFSPAFPILAVLIFNKIGDALPLLIFCTILMVVSVGSVVALVRIKEKSPGMKILGSLMGICGMLIAAGVSLLGGWALTKL